MNLLAFDTGTEMMSIAVARMVDGRMQLWQHTSAGGAQASTSLIATILDLMGQANLRLDGLDALCFGSGPGSFTGLRTACSVAQGLAFGAGVLVLPVDSLLAVAEEARFTALTALTDLSPRAAPGSPASGQITALLDARMDEMYAATYAYAGDQWSELQASRLVRPEDLVLPEPESASASNAPAQPLVMAGNVFAVYGARVAASDARAAQALRLPAMPTATAMLRLAPQLLAAGKAVRAEDALPRYIRDKVAKTTAEREAEKEAVKAAALAAVPPAP